MSLYFELMADNRPAGSVSVRNLGTPPEAPQMYAYHVTTPDSKSAYGVVEHRGAEDMSLVARVMQDYAQG